MAVVETRSYSRISGATSTEADSASVGWRRAISLECAPLVAGIGVGMEEGNRERADALADQLRHGIEEGRLVEGQAHAAVDGHALGHLEAQMTGDQRGGLHDIDVVELVLALAADLERVAEAPWS